MYCFQNYVENYLTNSQVYVEFHNLPHYHQPLSSSCSGALVLGKWSAEDTRLELSAFRIPFGKAIYTPPGIVHNDCFLHGEYQVVYGAADEFSSVLLYRQNEINEWTNLKIKIADETVKAL